MPKTSAIERNKKRIALSAKFGAKRAELKAILANPATTDEEFYAAQKKLQKLPKNSAAERVRNRCSMSGRPRAFIGRFGVAGDVSGSAPYGSSVTIKATTLVRGDDSGAKQATLGYEYYLSKRSTVYAYYTQTNNDKNANYTFGGNAFAATKKGAKLSGVMLGVIHLF